jgi:hypothetical protein
MLQLTIYTCASCRETSPIKIDTRVSTCAGACKHFLHLHNFRYGVVSSNIRVTSHGGEQTWIPTWQVLALTVRRLMHLVLQVEGYVYADSRNYQLAEARLCDPFAHQVVSPSVVVRELARAAPEVALRCVVRGRIGLPWLCKPPGRGAWLCRGFHVGEP